MRQRLSAEFGLLTPDMSLQRLLALRTAPVSRAFRIKSGVFSRDCTAWLGREDSNLRMPESKSGALPLGYAPICGTAQALAFRFDIRNACAYLSPPAKATAAGV